MRLVFPIAALLSIVFLFFYLPLFVTYTDTLDMDFQQYKLDKSIELSTRAAAENGLEHGLVTFDRELLSDVEFNASAVLSTYAQFMCFNYNLVPTADNREYILGRSVLMAVGGRGFNITQNEFGDFFVGADGQYHRVNGALSPGDVGGGGRATNTGARTLFGAYIPFTVSDARDRGNPNVEKLVSGSLLPGAKVFPIFTRDHANCTTGLPMEQCTTCVHGVSVEEQLVSAGSSVEKVRHEALALMSRAFAQSWNQLNLQASSDKQLTLPDVVTNLGVSSAANPGVMALVEGINFGTSKDLRSEAFTGYKAIVRREVVVFTQVVDGYITHWYCYRDQFNMDLASMEDTATPEDRHMVMADGTLADYNGVRIDYVYSGMLDAAKAKIFSCTHTNEQRCICPEYLGGPPTAPHCHYQPHLGFIGLGGAGVHGGG